MKVCLISTSRVAARNLGDELIAKRCEAMIRDIDPDAEIAVIWRGDTWTNVKANVEESDLVVLACLAIRKGLGSGAYPYLAELVATDVPIAVVSAGLSIGAFSSKSPLAEIMSSEDADLLKALGERSVFFSTRGYLTQRLLEELNVRSEFAGDVAFYQPLFSARRFEPLSSVTRIAVSDPHYAEEYGNSFRYLIAGLRKQFPDASIDMLVHGVNEPARALAQQADVPFVEMYLRDGLSTYDRYDLHVGYRIHGHVSALSRRIPSYLLEQDDRGSDYGAAFSRRISFASHRGTSGERKKVVADGDAPPPPRQILTSPVDVLLSVLRQDVSQSFARFSGLEAEVQAHADRNFVGLQRALAALGAY
jgi:hypothetical protein